MPGRNVVLMVAQDIAPSKAFGSLEEELKARGFETESILGHGRTVTISAGHIKAAVRRAIVVVLGVSNPKSPYIPLPELQVVAAAQDYGIPYVFCADVPGAYQREWLSSALGRANLYCSVTEADAAAAAVAFPAVRCVGTGNPDHEEMAYPRYTRSEARRLLGIPEDAVVVLSPGGKEAVLNGILWGNLAQALRGVSRARLLLAPHPGDRSVRAKEGGAPLDPYQCLESHACVPTSVIRDPEIKNPDVVIAADIIVEHGSTIAIVGAFQRIPVVTYTTGALESRIAYMTGDTTTPAVKKGISVPAGPDVSDLAQKIESLLLTNALRMAQERACPLPQKGTACKNIADAIEQLIASA